MSLWGSHQRSDAVKWSFVCSESQGHREDPLGWAPCLGLLQVSSQMPDVFMYICTSLNAWALHRKTWNKIIIQQTCTHQCKFSSLNSFYIFAIALRSHLACCPDLKHSFTSDLLLKQPDLYHSVLMHGEVTPWIEQFYTSYNAMKKKYIWGL